MYDFNERENEEKNKSGSERQMTWWSVWSIDLWNKNLNAFSSEISWQKGVFGQQLQ